MHSSLCPPASWRPVFVLHCFSVDLCSSLLSTSLLSSPHTPRSFFSLHCLFLSSLWHAFYKLDYNDCMRWQETTDSAVSSLMIFWCLAATVWMCVRARTGVCVCVDVCEKAREAPDCVVCLRAAGLVCMKSSTSVVELVMLLCSQVGNLSPHPLTVRTQHIKSTLQNLLLILNASFFFHLIHVIIGITRGAVKLLICVARQG